MPSTIEKVYRERKSQKFVVLAVNLQEGRDRVAAWARGAGVTMPMLLDDRGTVATAYRVTVTPTAVLIGRDGRMVGRAHGMRQWDAGPGRALLDALVAAPAPPGRP